MAEARSIALVGHEFRSGIGLNIDQDGLHVRFSWTIPGPATLLRRLLRKLRRSFRLLSYLTYPLSNPAVSIASIVGFVGLVLASPRDSWLRSGPIATWIWDVGTGMLPWIKLPAQYASLEMPMRVAVLAGWTGFAGLITAATLQRLLLKVLLQDRTWLYAGMGRTGFNSWVKTWFFLVRSLTYGEPLTYAFQRSLPRAPVPPLTDTVAKYLEYARVLQDDATYARTEEQARAFLDNEGRKLQRYLQLKSWFAPNYHTDWWEKYVYLKGRSSIAINSNYYVLDSGRHSPTPFQEARAAVLIYSIMLYCQRLAEERIPPVMLGDTVPLSMEQFVRMFATSRIPGREIDTIRHWDTENIRHIVVACKGSLYKLEVFRPDGSIRTPDELEATLCALKRDAAGRTPGPRPAEAVLPVLTSANRTTWAEVRETHFAEGVNRRSLAVVEQALMYVVLEDTSYDLLDWTTRGKELLAGNRTRPAIWFDKSINLIVHANGKAGLNCEHAWADAPVPAHCMELSMIVGEVQLQAYNDDGHCKPWSGAGRIPVAAGHGLTPNATGKVVPDTPSARIDPKKLAPFDTASAVHAPLPGTSTRDPSPETKAGSSDETFEQADLSEDVPTEGSGTGENPSNQAAAVPAGGMQNALRNRQNASAVGFPPVLGGNALTGAAVRVGSMPRAKSGIMGHSIVTAPTNGSEADSAAETHAPSLFTPGVTSGTAAHAAEKALQPVQLCDDGWARLPWLLSAELEEAILTQLEAHRAAIDGIDLVIASHSPYGKDFIKRCKVSPDAYIQAALQLAWYRDQGTFDNTYESSMTRLFLHGRTETVRPVTREMVSFVRAMADKDANPTQKLKALQTAAHRHVRGYTDAMAGLGIDRHIFALYAVSIGMGYDSPFLKAAIGTPWRLSTSQQPQQQTGLWDIKDPKWATRISPGGGFGPVADDGLGVSYQALEREFIFHISGWKKAAPKVDVNRFREKLFEALADMKTVLTLAVDSRDAAAAAAK